MALKVTHKFTSAKADGPDSTFVKPSNWNDVHDIVTDGGGGMVVGRDTSGPGPLQELPLAYQVVGSVARWIASVAGSFRLPVGTTAQRPTGASAGEVRWNSDLAIAEVYDGAAWQPIIMGAPGLKTGMVMGWYSNVVPDANWLFLNGDTLGSAASTATRASNLYQALFSYLWAIPSCKATVLPSPGADAASDWAANKTIKLISELGLVPAMPETTPTFLPAGGIGDVVGAPTVTPSGSAAGSTGGVPGGGIYGIVGGGPAVGDHAHSFNVALTMNASSVVQKTILRNSIIRV